MRCYIFIADVACWLCEEEMLSDCFFFFFGWIVRYWDGKNMWIVIVGLMGVRLMVVVQRGMG
jgi:hypothetical protein